MPIPSTPTLALSPDSDTGLSNSDQVTKLSHLSFDGTGEPGSTIYVKDGKYVLGQTQVGEDGNWSLTSDLLDKGALHMVYAYALKDGEYSATSDPLGIVYDTKVATPDKPGNGMYTAERNGVLLINDGYIWFTGEAEQNSTITLYDGDHAVASIVSELGNWQIEVNLDGEGMHNLTLVVTDAAGNVSPHSAVQQVEVVSHIDTPVIGLPAHTDTGVVGDGIVNMARPQLSGTATPGALVSLFVDGVKDTTWAWAGDDGAWLINPMFPLSDGAHSFVVQIEDRYGNISAPSAAVVLTIDTVKPDQPAAPQLAAESDNGVRGDALLTSDATPAFSGTSEAGAIIELWTYDPFYANKLLGTAVADADGHWTVTTRELNDGNYQVYLHIADVAGNTNNSPVQAFIVDTGAPRLASDSWIRDDQITNIATPTIIGNAAAGASVVLYDGATVIGTAVADKLGNWHVDAGKLGDGIHKITSVVTDAKGNPLPASGTLTITIDTVAAAAPAPQLLAYSDTGRSDNDGITGQNENLHFYGKAEAYATISVTIDGVLQDTQAQTDANGMWDYGIVRTYADGKHSVTVAVTDVAGNVSTASPALSFTVDTKAPAVASGLALAAGSDSGSSATDRVTSVTTPTITGKTEAGASVTLYDGELAVGSAIADAKGAWSITTSKLADGVHALTAVATDVAGNTAAASGALDVTVRTVSDSAAPTALTLYSDSGAPFDNLTNKTTPVINGKAAAGATVILYDGEVQVGKGVANVSGAWSITSSKLAEGAHYLTAVTTDAAGNPSAPSSGLVLTIDTEALPAPAAPVLQAAVDSGASDGDHVTNIAQLSFSGKALGAWELSVYDAGVYLGTVYPDEHSDWSFTTSKLSHGVHTLTVVAQDQAGNRSPVSAPLTVTVDLNAAPAPTGLDLLAAADNGASATDNITSNTHPVVGGKAEAGATVELYDGGALLGTAVADSKGAWQITAGAALADGVHALTARATDLAGNVSAASAALSVTIATTAAAPSALDLAAASDKGGSASDDLTNLATPVISGKAAAGASVILYDGATEIGKAVANAAGVWSITSSKLADGVHQLSAIAADLAGNVSPASAALAVTVDTGAPVAAAPLLAAGSDSGDSSSDNITNIVTPTVGGATEAGATVALYDGTALVGSTVADGKGDWSITSKALSAAAHKLTIKVTDLAGNVSASSAALALTIDNKGPNAPTALDLPAGSDSGVKTDNLTNANQPVIAGKAEANASVTLYDGATALGTVKADAGGNWQITAGATLADGVHSLTAKATDAAGNVSLAAAALKITIDTTVAAQTTLDLAAASDKGASASDNITNATTPVVTGKAEAGATVTLYEGATVLGKATANNSGVWSITSSKLADAEHHLSAKATDAAGNVSSASDELVLTIDTKAVLVASAPLLDAQSDSGRSASDGVTNITTPKVSGVTEAGAGVALYDGATLVGRATADNDGNWSITSTALSAAAHKLTVKVTDIAGNVSNASPALALTVDNKAPGAPTALDLLAIYDSGAVNTDNKTAITTPTISGKAEANAGVALYDGATLLGSAIADSSGAWKIASTISLGSGTHSLTAKATDVAGNLSAASSVLSLTIDPAATGLALAGTGAADSFVLNSQAGAIKVSGFSVSGGDHLLLAHDYNGLALNSAADVLALGHVDGKNFVIDLGAGHEVTLVGVTTLAEAAITLL
ncbi:Ig-like domain-containing protein [Duganella sp. PWIR1]